MKKDKRSKTNLLNILLRKLEEKSQELSECSPPRFCRIENDIQAIASACKQVKRIALLVARGTPDSTERFFPSLQEVDLYDTETLVSRRTLDYLLKICPNRYWVYRLASEATKVSIAKVKANSRKPADMDSDGRVTLNHVTTAIANLRQANAKLQDDINLIFTEALAIEPLSPELLVNLFTANNRPENSRSLLQEYSTKVGQLVRNHIQEKCKTEALEQGLILFRENAQDLSEEPFLLNPIFFDGAI